MSPYWCCKSATGNCTVEKYFIGTTIPRVVKCDGNRLNLTQQCHNGDNSMPDKCNYHPSDTFRNGYGLNGGPTSRSHIDVCQDSRLAAFLTWILITVVQLLKIIEWFWSHIWKEIHIPYLSALDFCNSSAWNIDELDFFLVWTELFCLL